MLEELVISMRPKQWYKNLVIFVCIVFSLNLLNIEMWFQIVFAFMIFCMLSGSEYQYNDILDIEKDKKHPKTRKRPIAAGKLKESHAFAFAIVIDFAALYWAYSINIPFFLISASYLMLMLFYSFYLKNFIIVDVLVISIGFVIRAVAGCLAISVFISPWLIICAFLLALFLALNKRRNELTSLGKKARSHRKILEGYTTEILDMMIIITMTTLIMSYSLYTFLSDNIFMMLTIPFVYYGLFRYLILVHSKDFGGEPEMMFKDEGMILSLGLWALLVVLILYGYPEKIIAVLEGIFYG